MTVTDVITDRASRTLTLTAEYRASTERVWQLWADPRQLERWWGPPTFPATVVDQHLDPGGKVTYFMTGPEGEQFHGYWDVTAVEPPTALEFTDGFADAEGAPSAEMPTTRTRVEITEAGHGLTRMVIRSAFPSAEAMDQLVGMGMVEGLRESVGQTDDLLRATADR